VSIATALLLFFVLVEALRQSSHSKNVPLWPSNFATGLPALVSCTPTPVGWRTAYVAVIFGRAEAVILILPTLIWAHSLKRLPCFSSDIVALILEDMTIRRQDVTQLEMVGVKIVGAASVSNPFGCAQYF